ncbi:MBL fold metallo-hydrolase [Desulfarculus baarsii]
MNAAPAMALTVLGSGCAELNPARSAPAYLLQLGPHALLLDLGQGAWRGLAATGVDAQQITAVLLSHQHPDHLADLLPLLFALNYDPRLKAGARITLVGHPGLADVLAGLEAVFGHWLAWGPPTLLARWLEPGQGLELAGARLSTAKSAHTAMSLAYRLDWAGRGLVYLGDCQASAALVELARDAALLVAHCAGTETNPKPGHMPPEACGELAAAAGVKSLLLSHFRAEDDPEAARAAAGRLFGGPIWAAHDLMRLAVGPDGARPI